MEFKIIVTEYSTLPDAVLAPPYYADITYEFKGEIFYENYKLRMIKQATAKFKLWVMDHLGFSDIVLCLYCSVVLL